MLGGEGAHGVLILGPRAVERLESYTPAWPLPKIFRMTKGGKLIEGIFKGETINTPSMLAVEDYIYALEWAKAIGGLDGADRARRRQCRGARRMGRGTAWLDHLAADPAIALEHHRLPDGRGSRDEAARVKKIASLLEAEDAAYDIAGYRDAPAGPAHLVRRDRRHRRYRGARPLARLGLAQSQRGLILPSSRRRLGSSSGSRSRPPH